jgi:hypothetical protein
MSFCAHESERQSQMQWTPEQSAETTIGVRCTASMATRGAVCMRSEQMTRSERGFHTRTSWSRPATWQRAEGEEEGEGWRWSLGECEGEE